jgi:hypothetical protein
MLQLETLVPALGASGGSGGLHDAWWLVLAAVVFAFVMPLAYLLGRNGGKPLHR